MVNQEWIEDKISKMERDRLLENWTEIREKQFQYLLEIYRTGKFLKTSYSKIKDEFETMIARYSR